MGGLAWTEEEDHLLKKCIEQYGEGKWHRVPLLAGLNRCRKSCRLRWLNYLRPNIRRGTFTDDEAVLIIKLHNHLGNRWSVIASRLPGRTANDVKNYWNCHLSKKLNKLNTDDIIPTSLEPVTANNQAANFALAAHPFETLTSNSTITSSSSDVNEDRGSLMMHHVDDIYYGLELGRVVSSATNMKRRGEGNCQQHEVMKDQFAAPEFDSEEMQMKARGGESNITMDYKWDWDELIFDMDLWG